MTSVSALESLGSVAMLLRAAAGETLDRADARGVDDRGFPVDAWRMHLGRRMDATSGLAFLLLDGQADLAELPEPVHTEPLELLTAAWALLGAVPLHELPAGTAALVLELADLLRAVRRDSPGPVPR